MSFKYFHSSTDVEFTRARRMHSRNFLATRTVRSSVSRPLNTPWRVAGNSRFESIFGRKLTQQKNSCIMRHNATNATLLNVSESSDRASSLRLRPIICLSLLSCDKEALYQSVALYSLNHWYTDYALSLPYSSLSPIIVSYCISQKLCSLSFFLCDK